MLVAWWDIILTPCIYDDRAYMLRLLNGYKWICTKWILMPDIYYVGF